MGDAFGRFASWCRMVAFSQKVLSGRLKMEDDASEILEALRDFLPGHIKLESDTIIIQ